MKLANRIHIILCDDVRTETGNKFSLMGVYHRNMVFKDFPAALPKLCFCIMIEGIKVDFRECNVVVKCPETEPMSILLRLSEENYTGRDMVLFAIMAPFRVKAAGTAKLEVRLGRNRRPSAVHKFEIQQVQ